LSDKSEKLTAKPVKPSNLPFSFKIQILNKKRSKIDQKSEKAVDKPENSSVFYFLPANFKN
jgi:hypothetical protein